MLGGAPAGKASVGGGDVGDTDCLLGLMGRETSRRSGFLTGITREGVHPSFWRPPPLRWLDLLEQFAAAADGAIPDARRLLLDARRAGKAGRWPRAGAWGAVTKAQSKGSV